MITTTICIAFILFYLVLIAEFSIGFDRVKGFQLQDLEPKTKFSIVVPFRNEAENLPLLLNSISRLNYPISMFEVILVNDDSDDNSIDIITTILDTKAFIKDVPAIDVIKMIDSERISNSPKKDAITSAIKIAKYDWIITTDADCFLPKYWLDAFDEFIQAKNPNGVVAPVTYLNKSSFFSQFQTLDFLSLQGATIGGFGLKKPFLCNGANFGYKKTMFNTIKGFDGNTNIASGDDVFLLEKLIKNHPKKVKYLKSEKAIVTTKPFSGVSNLIQQRLRWASKTSQSNHWFSKLTGIIVCFANVTILALLPLSILEIVSLRVSIALFVIKFSIDFLLLFKTTRFFRQENLLISYVFSSFIYPFFCVYIVFLSLFKSYNWKGRRFKI